MASRSLLTLLNGGGLYNLLAKSVGSYGQGATSDQIDVWIAMFYHFRTVKHENHTINCAALADCAAQIRPHAICVSSPWDKSRIGPWSHARLHAEWPKPIHSYKASVTLCELANKIIQLFTSIFNKQLEKIERSIVFNVNCTTAYSLRANSKLENRT